MWAWLTFAMDDELQLFLRDWRNELKKVQGERSTQVTVPIEEERSRLCCSATAMGGGKRDGQELCLDDEEERSLFLLQKRQRSDETSKEGCEGIPLFVLSCRDNRRTKSRSHPPRHKQLHVDGGIVPAKNRTKMSLVDTLIADLVRTESSVRDVALSCLWMSTSDSYRVF